MLTGVYADIAGTFDTFGAVHPVEQNLVINTAASLRGVSTRMYLTSPGSPAADRLESSLTLHSVVSDIASGLAMQLSSIELQGRSLTFIYVLLRY